MTCLSLIIASFIVNVAPETSLAWRAEIDRAKAASFEQNQVPDARYQMFKVDMLKMDRYERYLNEPLLMYRPQRYV